MAQLVYVGVVIISSGCSNNQKVTASRLLAQKLERLIQVRAAAHQSITGNRPRRRILVTADAYVFVSRGLSRGQSADQGSARDEVYAALHRDSLASFAEFRRHRAEGFAPSVQLFARVTV